GRGPGSHPDRLCGAPEAWSLRRPIDPGWTPRGAIVPDDRGYRGAIVPDDRGHRAGVAAGKSELLAHQGVERRRVLPTDQPPGVRGRADPHARAHGKLEALTAVGRQEPVLLPHHPESHALARGQDERPVE